MTNDDLRTFALTGMALGQTAFALLYVTFPWWRNFLGRALFAKALSLMVLLDFAVLARLLGFKTVDGAFTALYFLLALTIWGQFFAFVKVKRDAKRVDREFYDSKINRTFPETEPDLR